VALSYIVLNSINFSLAPDITLVLGLTLEYKHLKIGKRLGKGAYATVYEAHYGQYVTLSSSRTLSYVRI
jgi:hypothetical protein